MNTNTQTSTVTHNNSVAPNMGNPFSLPEICIDDNFVTRLKSFLEGEITWSQVEGWTPQMAYRFAVLGFDLMRSGKLKDSRKVFSALFEINPRDWYFPYSLAQVERLLGNHEESLCLLDQSIEIEPTFGEPWLLKGICQMEMGLKKEAKKSLIQARNLGKTRSDEKMSCFPVPLSTALLERLTCDG